MSFNRSMPENLKAPLCSPAMASCNLEPSVKWAFKAADHYWAITALELMFPSLDFTAGVGS